MKGPVHVYEHLTQGEIGRVRLARTADGGGAQGWMYQLASGLSRDRIEVEDWVFEKLGKLVSYSSFGGHQNRLPFELHIELLENLGRFIDAEKVRERRHNAKAVLPGMDLEPDVQGQGPVVFDPTLAVWTDGSPEAVAILERDEQAVEEILAKGGPHADTIIHNRCKLGIPLPPFTKRNTR